MGFAPDQLRDLALAVLDDAAERSRAGPIERGLGLRFALAYLWAYAAGNREPFDRFWRSLADPNTISRSQNVNAALNGIRLALGSGRTTR